MQEGARLISCRVSDASYQLSDKALVLLSGGQDSTTCLAWALAHFAAVETVGFDYGQRHRVELDCRVAVIERLRREFPDLGGKLGEDHVIDLQVLGEVSDTALTRDTAIAFEKSGLPNTFVPGRNLLFFTLAAAIGYRRGARHLVGGMCEADYSGYPDCRDDTLKALQATLTLGMDHRFVIHTPLMWRDKAASWCGWRRTAAISATASTCICGAMVAASARPAACGATDGRPLPADHNDGRDSRDPVSQRAHILELAGAAGPGR